MKAKIPQTSNDQSGSREFEKYVDDNRISVANELCVKVYQDIVTDSSDFVSSYDLNHYLTLKVLSNDSRYIDCASKTKLTDLSDFEPKATNSERALSAVFEAKGCEVDGESVLYKGIDTHHPFYEYLSLQTLNIEDEFTLYGYVSTSASRERALHFCSGTEKFLLEISKINNTLCIFPENSQVIGMNGSATYEQEVIINKGCTFILKEHSLEQFNGHEIKVLKVHII
ncbi:TPA: ADP-ribosyltransferase [Vibrio cholerae]